MDETVILEWSYSPADFIEECISITEQGYVMKIDQGKIEAKVKGDYFDSHPVIMQGSFCKMVRLPLV
jgi:hypothetical protein